MDDLKALHVEEKIVESIVKDMENKFGKETPLMVLSGPVYNYLGMMLDFSQSGQVIIHMVDYVKNMLHNAPNDMDDKASPLQQHICLR